MQDYSQEDRTAAVEKVKMGNTTSKGNGVYFFVDPVEESRKRRDHFLRAQAKAEDKLRKKDIPIPEIVQKELLPERTRMPSQAEAPEPTVLTCYAVVLGKEYEVWQRLLWLTTLMRVEPALRILATEARLILHLRGDFGNPSNNGIMSALFATKPLTRILATVLTRSDQRYISSSQTAKYRASHMF
jgi:hypothetical protein